MLAPSSQQDSKFYTDGKTKTWTNLRVEPRDYQRKYWFYILSWEHRYRSSDWRGISHKMSPAVGSG